MITLKLMLLMLMLLGLCASAYARKGWKAERTLPASLCAQSLILMAVSSFATLTVGVGLLAVLSAAAWVDALVHIRSLRRAAGFFSLPCLIFIGSALLLYDACAPRLFLSYDEHSHWGLIVKMIHLYDELPHAGRGAAYVQFTYPPGTAMMPALACRLLGYRDGIAYFGYTLFLEGLLLGLASCAGRWVTLCAAALYMALMAVFPLGAMRLFCEPAAALLMALLVAGALEDKDECPLCTGLYAAMLAATKSTGMVFLLMALAARLAVRGRKALRQTLGLLLCGAVPTLFYRLFCQAQGIQARMSPSHLGENLSALLAGTLGEPYTSVPARYVQFLFSHRLSQAGIYTCYGFGTSAMVLGAVLLLCGVHVLASSDRRRALRLWGGVWLANLAYLVMIVGSYLFFFEEWEVRKLSEADRYTVFIALWTALLACVLLFKAVGGMRMARRVGAVGALLAVLLPLSHPEMTVKTFITKDYVHNTVWARDATDRMTLFLKEKLAGEENVKLLCMGDYKYVELHYTLAGVTDIGGMDKSWPYAPWRGSAGSLRDALEANGYTHVFVAGLTIDEEMIEDKALLDGAMDVDARYAVLTDDGRPLCANSLYRVVQGEDGRACLSHWATMPEEIN